MTSWWNENDDESYNYEPEHDAEETRQMIKEYYKRQRQREERRREEELQHLADHRDKHASAVRYLRELSRMDAERRERDHKLLTSRGYGKRTTFKRLLPSSDHWKYNKSGQQEPHYIPGIALYDKSINMVVSYSSYNQGGNV